MPARLGNILFWLGAVIAVLAIAGAIVWNGWTSYELREATQEKRNLLSAYEKLKTQGPCLPQMASGPELAKPIKPWERFCLLGEVPTLNYDRQIDEHLTALMNILFAVHLHDRDVLHPAEINWKESTFVGGELIAFGLIAYGAGRATRHVLRRPDR